MKPTDGPGVSTMVKLTAVVAIVGAAVLVWYLRRDTAPAPAKEAAAPAAGSSASPAAKPRPNDRVRKVTPAERAQLAKQIRDGRSGRAATSAPAGPSLPSSTTPAPKLEGQPALDPNDIESFKTTMKAAMKEVIPYLAECYDKHSADLPESVTVRAKLTLTGDPDVGTLIDTNGLTDTDEAPLQTGFDTCLRDALAGLALPPLAEGEEVKVTYPFLFTR